MKPLGVRILTAVLATIGLVVRGAERDWTGVELAWRGDPRATADAPFEAEMAPTRRLSRRAQRRAASRRWVPIEAAPAEAAAVPGGGGMWSANAPTTISYDPVLRGGAVPGGVIVHRDQPSLPTADARQRFDIFLPAGCVGGGMPLVVWIHGDSWRDGSRAECPVAWLAESGYAVASVGYRLSDAATFPAQLDDCRAALDEIRRTAEVWGIDPERIAVAGSGAGGHLAALAGLAGPEEPGVAAVCAVAAPAHLPSLGPEHQRPSSPASQFVGGPLAEFREVAQRASPLAHVSTGDPPCLLIHGDRDELIPAEQSVKLDAALRGAGVESRLVILPGTGHRTPLGRGSPAGRELVEFLDRTLGAGVRTSAATP